MADALMVGTEYDDLLRDANPGKGLSGDTAGIAIAGVGRNDSGNGHLPGLGRKKFEDGLPQGPGVPGIELASDGGLSLHSTSRQRV
jgi:hypothetical protein